MSDDNWTGVDWPCFEGYGGAIDEELLECELHVNTPETRTCAHLAKGGTWHDCSEGRLSPQCPESLKAVTQGGVVGTVAEGARVRRDDEIPPAQGGTMKRPQRGEIFFRGQYDDSSWGAIDVFDLDEDSFRSVVLYPLRECFTAFIPEDQGDPPPLRAKQGVRREADEEE